MYQDLRTVLTAVTWLTDDPWLTAELSETLLIGLWVADVGLALSVLVKLTWKLVERTGELAEGAAASSADSNSELSDLGVLVHQAIATLVVVHILNGDLHIGGTLGAYLEAQV